MSRSRRACAEAEAIEAAANHSQLGLAHLASGIGRQHLQLLLAERLAVGFILPCSYNVEFHVNVSFQCSGVKYGSLPCIWLPTRWNAPVQPSSSSQRGRSKIEPVVFLSEE